MTTARPKALLEAVGVVTSCPLSGDDLFEGIAHNVFTVRDATAAVHEIRLVSPELMIIREDVPADEGMDILQLIRSVRTELPVVVVSKEPDVDQAVRFVRAGAYDILTGPLTSANLLRLVEGMRREKVLADKQD